MYSCRLPPPRQVPGHGRHVHAGAPRAPHRHERAAHPRGFRLLAPHAGRIGQGHSSKKIRASMNPGSEPDFRSQIEALRPYLIRYASLQLRNREAAEDAVQEPLLAAVPPERSFEGLSNLRAWPPGILKHRVNDAIRRASRES